MFTHDALGEYEAILRLLTELGVENGWVQEMCAAEEYLPDFEQEGHPFSPVPQGREDSMLAKVSRDH